MTNKLSILLIDDSEDDEFLLERAIRKDVEDCELLRVSDAKEMNQALREKNWDVILCDYMMPNFNIENAMEILSDSDYDIPFIIVSGAIPDELAVALMRKGANDYITKGNLSRLVPAIKREIREAEDRNLRRTAEEQLRKSEIQYRRTFDAISDPAYLWQRDANGNLILVSINKAIREYTIGAMERYVGLNVSEIFPNDTWIINLINETMKTGQHKQIERPFVHGPNKESLFIWDFTKPAEDLVLLITTDVTEERRMINALKTSEHELRAAKDRAVLYLDLLGHDIRNQLQAILGGAEIVQELIDQEDAKRLIKGVTDAATRCDRIINKVKMTESLRAYPLVKRDLKDSVASSLSRFSKVFPEAEIFLNTIQDEALVMADHFMDEIWLNLMENAIEHNPKEKKRIWIDILSKDSGYSVKIGDDGKGIPDNVKEGLFDVNRRFGGVSLHITKEIVEKYSGLIEVGDRIPSDPHEGAEFSVWLPKAK